MSSCVHNENISVHQSHGPIVFAWPRGDIVKIYCEKKILLWLRRWNVWVIDSMCYVWHLFNTLNLLMKIKTRHHIKRNTDHSNIKKVRGILKIFTFNIVINSHWNGTEVLPTNNEKPKRCHLLPGWIANALVTVIIHHNYNKNEKKVTKPSVIQAVKFADMMDTFLFNRKDFASDLDPLHNIILIITQEKSR